MTTVEDFAAAGAGVGGESYTLNPFDVLAIAETMGGADRPVSDDEVLNFVMSCGLAINDLAAIRCFLAGSSEKIPGYERLLFDAELVGREDLLGAYALGFNEMLPSRTWIPVIFKNDDQELIAGGMMGLHSTNSAAPVLLLPDGASGVEVPNNLRRLGLLQTTVYKRADLTERARRQLAQINAKRPPKKPPRVWPVFD